MRIRSYRILSQFIFLFLSIIGIAGVAKTGLIFPFFFCNASPGAVCVCPLWALEHASIMMRIDFKTALATLLFLFGFLGLIGFFVGRSFCGWACPIGFIQDIAKHFKKKIRIPFILLIVILLIGIGMVILPLLIILLRNTMDIVITESSILIATGYIGTLGVAVIALALYAILIELDNLFIKMSAVFFCAIGLILILVYLWDQPGIREVTFFIVLVQLFVSILTIAHKYVLTQQTTIRDTKFYYRNPYYKIKYVMLVGNIDFVPVRYTNACGYDGSWNFYFISDLYYADIYDSNGSFCSWDSNNDGFFAGKNNTKRVDTVDYYPDVFV